MKALGAASAVQLAIQLVEARKAIRERIPYDLPYAHGEPDNVARDMWTMGSGISAPWPPLAAHAAFTIMVFMRPRPWLRSALGGLGMIYVLGYLGERGVRESFRRPYGSTSVLNAIAVLLATVMVVLGLVRRS